MRREVPVVLTFLTVLMVVGSPIALAAGGGASVSTPADQSNSIESGATDAGLATDDSDNESDDGDKPPGNDTTDGFTHSAAASTCVDLAPFMYQGSDPPNFCHMLGNDSTEGHLRVLVADGLLGTQRYSDGEWVNQFYTYSGAVIVVDGEKTSLGYYNDQPDPTGNFWGSLSNYEAPASQSISADGTTVTTTWNVDGVVIEQEITLSDRDDQFYRLDWEITNEGGSTVGDVHFLRGEDTYLAGGDFGDGFWNAGTNTVGVTKTVDGVQQRLSFQGITDPAGYHSAFYSTVIDDVESGSLDDSVDTSNHDNGYALEWQRDAIEPGASWNIRSVESFVRSSLSVSGGGTQTLDGTSETFTFNVSNLGQEARTVDYSVDCPAAGVSCSTPNSETIDAGATSQVQVTAEVADDIDPGTYEVVFTASAEGVQSAQSVGQLDVQGPNFQVTGVTAPSSASVESPITFTAEVTNTGAESGTRTVTARFAGATITSRTVTLDAGESRTLGFTAAAGTAGTYDATVSTGDDVGSASVEVVGQEFICGQSTGDPHITTFGGASYDFMAAGDFVAAREPAGDLLVVARQAPVSDSVSNNNATATTVGNDRVVIDAEADTPVSVNGDPVELASGESVPVGDGGEIRKQGRTYTVIYPGDDGQADASDEHLTVDVIGNRVDIKLCLHPDREGEIEGLFGDTDGDASDDIAFDNGTALDRPLDPDQLYGDFRDDWRATGEEAIVNGIYYRPNFPRSIVTVDDLSQEDRERAEAVLEDTCLEPGTPQYNDALLDVALSGDESYVASACQVNRENVEDADEEADDAAGFEVTGVSAPSSVSTETPFTFSGVITNTGTSQGTVTVEGSYATALVDTRTVTLDPGASRTVSFGTTSQSVAGTHTATVSTASDEASATVEVVGQEFVCGSSTGDPHLRTFDGVGYDFQDAGDFVAARSVGGQSPFTIHVRQVPVRNSVSVNNATATTVGNDRVVIDASNDTPLAINGDPTPVEDGGSVSVGDGGEVRRQGTTYTVVYPGDDGQADASDEHLTVHVRGNRVDLEVCLFPDRENVEGILGDTDGDASDDIAFDNGTALDRPLRGEVLYGEFSDDWQVTGDENLFEQDYVVENFPQSVVGVDDLSTEERERAEEVLADTCLEPGTAAYRDALIDVALTGDDSYVASACQSNEPEESVNATGETGEASGVSVSLQPAEGSVAPGGSITLDIVVEGTPDGEGVGSYELTVNSSDTSIATIASVSDGIGGVPRSSTAPDGSGIRAAAFSGSTADTGPVTIATVTVEGVARGTVDVPLSVTSVSNESGTRFGAGSTAGASLTVEQTCPDVNGDGSPATDPDDDGLCEDVNGDGDSTPGDATVLFNAVFDNDPAVTDNVASFDFNGDGGVTPGDATVLFNEIFG